VKTTHAYPPDGTGSGHRGPVVEDSVGVVSVWTGRQVAEAVQLIEAHGYLGRAVLIYQSSAFEPMLSLDRNWSAFCRSDRSAGLELSNTTPSFVVAKNEGTSRRRRSACRGSSPAGIVPAP
jgi:hypothetical protein